MGSTENPEPGPPSEATAKHLPRVMGFADLLMFYVVTGFSLR
jgi:hypothetical protein